MHHTGQIIKVHGSLSFEIRCAPTDYHNIPFLWHYIWHTFYYHFITNFQANITMRESQLNFIQKIKLVKSDVFDTVIWLNKIVFNFVDD